MIKLAEKVDVLALLFSKPNDFIIERIKDKTMREMLETAFPKFSWEDFSNEDFIENIVEKIERDYLYLFVGVSKPLASPYESSYFRKEPRLMDKPARKHIKLMEKWGLELDESFKDLPDHIVAKLSIISVLLRHKEEVDEEVLKAEIDKDIRAISQDLTWIENFKENIKENEEGHFYSKIAEALYDTLKDLSGK